MDRDAIARRLRDLRGDKPRKEAAIDLGLTYVALSMYEQGRRIPEDDVKRRIAEYYGQSVDGIFFA